MKVFLPLVLGVVLFTVRSFGEEPLNPARLANAYGHVKIAMKLAQGGAAEGLPKYVEEAQGMDPGEVRKNIGIMCDNTVSAFHGAPPLARLQAITHLQAARHKLTSNLNRTVPEIRKHFEERYEKQRKAGETPSAEADARGIVKIIKEALSPH